MSRWKEQFDAHPVHSTLDEISKCVRTEFEDIDENEAVESRRLLKGIDSYQKALSNIDAELVPMNQLDSLNNSLKQNVLPQVTNYSNNGSVNHLVTANDQLTNNFTQLTLILALSKKAISTTSVKQLEEGLDKVSEAITARKDELNTQLAELEKRASESKRELGELEQIIEKRKSETDSQLSQWQQQFAESQERRNTEYTTWREKTDEDARKSIKELISASNKQLDEENKEFEKAVDEYLSDAKQKHTAILELYELTAGDSVGASYLQNADGEKSQANFWRWASIIFIVATVGWLFYVYSQPLIPSPAEDFPWAKLFNVLSLTGVLLFGAAYSSQQSNRHRLNEKRLRWFALQVKAIDPFISSLDEPDRNNLKSRLSDRLFGKTDEGDEASPGVLNEHALKVVAKSLADILEKLPKS